MNRKLLKLAWIVILIVVISVGCNPSTTRSVPTPTHPPATTSTPELSFPIGVFTKANWTMEFRADGTCSTKQQSVNTDGTYTVTGNQMATQSDYAPCKDIVGTYTWAYDGAVLSFRVVDDKCMDRKNMMDYSKWQKKP